MLALLADEHVNNDIVRGLIRRYPAVNVVRVQDVGLTSAEAPAILDWAAAAGRVVVTHDAATMIGFAYARVDDGRPMPGLIVVSPTVAIAQAIEDLVLLVAGSRDDEWAGLILDVPLR